MNSSYRPVSIRARYVVPVIGPPIRNGEVAVHDGKIVAVGTADEIARQCDPVERLDLGDFGGCVLLPGLINAHTHLEFSDLTHPLGQPGMDFTDWIRLVMKQRHSAAESANRVDDVIRQGLIESRDSGVAAVGEISTHTSRSNSPDVRQVSFLELIGLSAARIEDAQSRASEHLEGARLNLQNSNAITGLSPHAPYSCHVDLVEHACRLSAEKKFPVSMHLAETTDELQLIQNCTGPMRDMLEEFGVWNKDAFAVSRSPLDYLKMLADANRSLVIHGNYLAQDEFEFMSQHAESMSVVFCPRTHSFFRHDDYPLNELLAAGVRVALGTDSRASNPDLSLWSEAKQIHRMFPGLDPTRIVEMATIDGAGSLGLNNTLGSLQKNRSAMFSCFSGADRGFASDSEIAEMLLTSDPDVVLQQTARKFIANQE